MSNDPSPAMPETTGNSDGNRIAWVMALLLSLVWGLSGCAVANRAWLMDSASVNNNLQKISDQNMLLNIVRLHHHDSPEFLQVGNVQATYLMKTQATAAYGLLNMFPFMGIRSAAGLSDPSQATTSTGDAGVTADFETQPSITYSPISGEAFTKQYLTEIRPETVILLIKAGWPVDLVMDLFVTSICDDNGRMLVNDPTDPSYKEFRKWVATLKRSQLRHNLSIVVYEEPASQAPKSPATEDATVAAKDPKDTKETAATAPSQPATTSNSSRNPVAGERCIKSDSGYLPLRSIVFRTLLDAMKTFSRHVESSNGKDSSIPAGPPYRIKNALFAPKYAMGAVSYKGRTYYIDDNDPLSKDALELLEMIGHIQSSPSSTGPVLTIPVSR